MWQGIGRALLSAYFILVGFWDLRIERGIVPNWLTLPALGLVVLVRLSSPARLPFPHNLPGGWKECLLSWGVIFLLWMLHTYGGGDAKFLMVEFGLFPTLAFATLMATSIILIEAPIQMKRRGLLRCGKETLARIATLDIFPGAEEFERGKEPGTRLFVPAGIIYTWLFW